MKDKIDIVVKIPLNQPHEEVMQTSQYVIEELLKERDWPQPHEKKMTFMPTDESKISDNSNFVEFNMVLTPNMTKGDLTDLSLQFTRWLKDTDE